MKLKNSYLLSSVRVLVLICLSVLSFSAVAQKDIPDAPSPPRLYNNFSTEFPDFLSSADASALEADLEKFAKSTSNQIVVVVVDDLNGYEPVEYATKLGDKWKVGDAKRDNGIVVLIKPTEGDGGRRTFIAVGKGLGGPIPDITAKRIVDEEIIPYFKEGNFYGGIRAGLNVMEKLAKGEYNSAAYASGADPTLNDEERLFLNIGRFGWGALCLLWIIYNFGINQIEKSKKDAKKKGVKFDEKSTKLVKPWHVVVGFLGLFAVAAGLILGSLTAMTTMMVTFGIPTFIIGLVVRFSNGESNRGGGSGFGGSGGAFLTGWTIGSASRSSGWGGGGFSGGGSSGGFGGFGGGSFGGGGAGGSW